MPTITNRSLDRQTNAPRPAACHDARHRDAAELLRRARAMDADSKLLVELWVDKRLSHRQIARLLRINPGTVCRRLRQCLNRLNDPVVVALTDPYGDTSVPTLDRTLALDHVLNRVPLRTLATRHGMSLHAVSQRLDYVRGWAKGRRDGWGTLRRSAGP